MDLCAACGVVRIERQAKCAHCGAAHEPRASTKERTDDALWVCVECAFTCRMCAFSVPLNHLDMDGAVLCARCGLEQAFDVRAWVDALQYSHAVAELFGPRADGIDPEVASVGVKRASVKHEIGGQNAFTVTTSPGYPLCPQCRAFVEVAPGDAGVATVTCTSCNTRASYALPVAAQRMMKTALRTVIADEHRIDRAAVKVEEATGAVAIRCPSCNAALPASSESKFILCKYCNTTSRIPDHQWFRISGKEPTSESMWLMFQGPSRAHKERDRSAAREADAAHRREEKQHAHEQRMRDDKARAAQKEAERKATAEAEREARQADLEEEAVQKRREDASQRRGTLLFFGIPLLIMAIAFVIIYLQSK